MRGARSVKARKGRCTKDSSVSDGRTLRRGETRAARETPPVHVPSPSQLYVPTQHFPPKAPTCVRIVAAR